METLLAGLVLPSPEPEPEPEPEAEIEEAAPSPPPLEIPTTLPKKTARTVTRVTTRRTHPKRQAAHVPIKGGVGNKRRVGEYSPVVSVLFGERESPPHKNDIFPATTAKRTPHPRQRSYSRRQSVVTPTSTVATPTSTGPTMRRTSGRLRRTSTQLTDMMGN